MRRNLPSCQLVRRCYETRVFRKFSPVLFTAALASQLNAATTVATLTLQDVDTATTTLQLTFEDLMISGQTSDQIDYSFTSASFVGEIQEFGSPTIVPVMGTEVSGLSLLGTGGLDDLSFAVTTDQAEQIFFFVSSPSTNFFDQIVAGTALFPTQLVPVFPSSVVLPFDGRFDGGGTFVQTFESQTVPEPSSVLLLAGTLAGFAMRRKR